MIGKCRIRGGGKKRRSSEYEFLAFDWLDFDEGEINRFLEGRGHLVIDPYNWESGAPVPPSVYIQLNDGRIIYPQQVLVKHSRGIFIFDPVIFRETFAELYNYKVMEEKE